MEDKKIPPYLKKQMEYYSLGYGVKPGLYHSVIKHDNWCNLLNKKGMCNCNPTVLPPMTDSEYSEYLKNQE